MSEKDNQIATGKDNPVRSLGDAMVHGTAGNNKNASNNRARAASEANGATQIRKPQTISIDPGNSNKRAAQNSPDHLNSMNDSASEEQKGTEVFEQEPELSTHTQGRVRSRKTESLPPFKVIRVAFKVMNNSYTFKGYDELKLNNEGFALFEDEVFNGSKFYDLCRKKGVYKRYSPDFIQTYCCSLFNNTPFPSSVFVFVEELEIENNAFTKEPCVITMRPEKHNHGLSSFFDLPSFRQKVEKATPEYELFYIESPRLSVENGSGSQNDVFLSVTSRYLRQSIKARGVNFSKPGGFNMYADSVGMEFIKFTPYQGIVPNLKSSTTLVPLILMIARAIGYKCSMRRINKVLGNTLSQKLAKSNKLRRRAKKNLKDLNFVYCGVELFLTQSFLVSSISYQNTTAQDIFREVLSRLNVAQDYGRIKEQIEPLNHMLHQLSIAEMIRGQIAIRFSVLALGFFMVVLVVVVSAILGVEPMVRLLNDLGLIPPNLLKLN